MHVRSGTPDDALSVRRIVDAAVLVIENVEERIAAGDVLVAVEPEPDGERILGALVLEPEGGRETEAETETKAEVGAEAKATGARITAIAVRRRRRDQGIGTALVEAALEREGRLTARFDGRVEPFYESLGFAIEPIGDGRYEGRRSA